MILLVLSRLYGGRKKSNYKKKKGVKKDVLCWNGLSECVEIVFVVDVLLFFDVNWIMYLFFLGICEFLIGSDLGFLFEFDLVGLLREDNVVIIFGLLDILVLVILVFVLFFYY